MKPVLHARSDSNDSFLRLLVSCISSINCSEQFADYLGDVRTKPFVVKPLQAAVCSALAADFPEIRWSLEHKQRAANKDAVDIFGTGGKAPVLIELDTSRADQVAKKFLSRSAIFEEQIYYVSLCYPGTDRMSVSECIKYFGYCATLSRRLGSFYAGFIIQRTGN